MESLKHLIVVIMFATIAVTSFGTLAYLIVSYRLQRYMEANEKDYWKSIGEPGFSFDKSIQRSKAYRLFITSKGYLKLKSDNAVRSGKVVFLLGRICTVSSVLAMIFFIGYFITLI